jgi:chromatin remodeling complex protein RSC6
MRKATTTAQTPAVGCQELIENVLPKGIKLVDMLIYLQPYIIKRNIRDPPTAPTEARNHCIVDIIDVMGGATKMGISRE